MRVLLFVGTNSDVRRLAGVVSALPEAHGYVRVLSVAPRLVLPPPPPPPWDPAVRVTAAELGARASTDGARLTKRAAAGIGRLRQDLVIDTETRSGPAQHEIVEAADAWAADLVVMGVDGSTRLDRWAALRVARSVVSRAPCSVLIVRQRGPSQRARAFEPRGAIENRAGIHS